MQMNHHQEEPSALSSKLPQPQSIQQLSSTSSAATSSSTTMEMTESEDDYDDIHLIFDIPDFNLIDNLKFENYSIIGLDTDRPMVKIDNFIFEGKFENLLS